jgi:hypothetical protein
MEARRVETPLGLARDSPSGGGLGWHEDSRPAREQSSDFAALVRRGEKASDYQDIASKPEGSSRLTSIIRALGDAELELNEPSRKRAKDTCGHVKPPEFMHVVRIGGEWLVGMRDGHPAGPV